MAKRKKGFGRMLKNNFVAGVTINGIPIMEWNKMTEKERNEIRNKKPR